MRNITAYTAPGPAPAFISINSSDTRGIDGVPLVEIIVRSESPAPEASETGPIASIKMSVYQFKMLVNEMQQASNLLWKAY